MKLLSNSLKTRILKEYFKLILFVSCLAFVNYVIAIFEGLFIINISRLQRYFWNKNTTTQENDNKILDIWLHQFDFNEQNSFLCVLNDISGKY